MTKTMTAYPASLVATKITAIGTADSKTSARKIILADRREVTMTGLQWTGASVGDYYVEPNEGYPYTTPKATFVQSYTVSG